jgi:hypothetical protein
MITRTIIIHSSFSSLLGRFKVDDVIQDKREDCYLATLHITQADIQDARPYYLVVENERGIDRHSITLKVEGLFSGNFCIIFQNKIFPLLKLYAFAHSHTNSRNLMY